MLLHPSKNSKRCTARIKAHQLNAIQSMARKIFSENVQWPSWWKNSGLLESQQSDQALLAETVFHIVAECAPFNLLITSWLHKCGTNQGCFWRPSLWLITILNCKQRRWASCLLLFLSLRMSSLVSCCLMEKKNPLPWVYYKKHNRAHIQNWWGAGPNSRKYKNAR